MTDNVTCTRKEYDRLKRIEAAAEMVYGGLLQRIDAAPVNAKPVYHGIVELHDAIASPRK
jgi:hypothetical protein